MKFYIHTLGCRVNQAESDMIASQLMAKGNVLTHAEDADLIIVNSCTVTGEADHKNRKTIRSLLRKSNACLILTGCAINIDSKIYSDLDKRIICEQDKNKIVDLAALISANKKIKSQQPQREQQPQQDQERPQQEQLKQSRQPQQQQEEAQLQLQQRQQPQQHTKQRTRRNLKVQDGCNNACTFCIVHVARGPAQSTPLNEVINRAQKYIAEGAKEIVLTGIDLGAYNNPSLPALINELLNKTSIKRIRLSSIEPQSIDDELINLLKKSNGRLCRYLHIPLQSGSDKILKEMGRKYSAAQYLNLIQNLRTSCPEIAISTDVIVGFPGESNNDFEKTYELVKKCAFMKLHIFRYSKRKDTPAAMRADQIDAKVKATRAKKLAVLGHDLSTQDKNARKGKKELMVVEKIDGNLCTGTTESFHAAAAPVNAKVGDLIEVTL